jgi:AcrR family transcriptional regulator
VTVADTPSSLLAAGLAGEADAPGDATSERILDAALTLAAASGLRHLTMDDVAARAKVGRMTVYRRFGDKQRLVEALGAREVRRCLAELDAAGNLADPIADQIADGFVASMRIAREHPLLNRLARVEPEAVLEATIADGAATFELARAYMAGRLRAAQAEGSIGDLDVDAAAEILVRLAISFVLIQPSVLPLDDPDRMREIARELIAPIVSSGRAA